MLRLRGYVSKALVWRSSSRCEIIALKRDEELYAVVVARDREGRLYSKIVPGSSTVSLMECSELLYSPWGLYVFAGDVEGIVSGIAGKLERVARQGREAESPGK